MTKTQFRAVVVASIALGLITAIIGVVVDPPVPPERTLWALKQAEAGISVFQWFLTAMLIPLVVATIGLLYFARWSRALYAITIGVFTVATLFVDPWPYTALDTFASDAAQLLDGFILGVAYFSDARHHFGSHAQPAAA